MSAKVLSVSRVFEDGRDVARPHTFTVRLGAIVRHERYPRREQADRARVEVVADLARFAEYLHQR